MTTKNDKKTQTSGQLSFAELVAAFEDHIRSQGYSRAIIRKYQRSAQAL